MQSGVSVCSGVSDAVSAAHLYELLNSGVSQGPAVSDLSNVNVHAHVRLLCAYFCPFLVFGLVLGIERYELAGRLRRSRFSGRVVTL